MKTHPLTLSSLPIQNPWIIPKSPYFVAIPIASPPPSTSRSLHVIVSRKVEMQRRRKKPPVDRHEIPIQPREKPPVRASEKKTFVPLVSCVTSDPRSDHVVRLRHRRL
uniref:Uncharacterized protein n=1 Tax=Steinernema glaseri TaxID=37863 RepID=A0A1I8ADV6_9BILA